MQNIVNRMYQKIIRLLLLGRQVYYINGSEALPPPLSKSEEAGLIDRLAHGETGVRKALIERNIRLVVYIARKFDNTGIGLEDLISIGTIGLIKGINTFNVDKGAKLATYAARCVENEILMYLRSQKKRKCEVSINDPIGTDKEGNEYTFNRCI